MSDTDSKPASNKVLLNGGPCYTLSEIRWPLQLPCGLIEMDATLASEVELYPLTGVEEDLLADDSMGFSEAKNRVVANCLKRLGTHTFSPSIDREPADDQRAQNLVKRLRISDLGFLQTMIAWISNIDGHLVRRVNSCPASRCKNQQPFTSVTDLRTVVITPMPDPVRGLHTFKLPQSGKVVVYRHHIVNDEKDMATLIRQNPAQLASVGLWKQIVSVDGEKVAGHRDLRAWSSADRDALRADIDRTDGGIDLFDDITCPHCKSSWRAPRIEGPAFFFPSMVASGQRPQTEKST